MSTTTKARPTNVRTYRVTPEFAVVQADRNGLVTYCADTSTVTTAGTIESQVPAHVWAVVGLIQSQFPGIDLFLADRNHGDVEHEGSWSIAHEGHYEWPTLFCAAQHDDRNVPAGTHIEPIAGWCLGVYPEPA